MKTGIITTLAVAMGILSIAPAAWGQSCAPSQYQMLQMCGGTLGCVPYCDQLNSPPAEVWNNYWGAIVRDPKTGQLGTSNHQNSESQAIKSANADCVQRGGSSCETRLPYRNACAAVATGTNATSYVARNSLENARSEAIAECSKSSTTPCKILYSDCSLPVRVR